MNKKNKISMVLECKIIQDLCHSLFAEYPITIMNYIRVYKNPRQVIYLCDNQDWIKLYLNNKFYNVGEFETNESVWELSYFLWKSFNPNDPIFMMSKTLFNIHSGITLIKNSEDYAEFFNYGTCQRDSESLICYVDKLTAFSLDFTNKAKKLLLTPESKAVLIKPSHYKLNHFIANYPKRLYLGPQYNYQYITETEMHILTLLSQGMTSIAIAKLSNGSERTVEKHIENIKAKLNCRTLFELGYLARQII